MSDEIVRTKLTRYLTSRLTYTSRTVPKDEENAKPSTIRQSNHLFSKTTQLRCYGVVESIFN